MKKCVIFINIRSFNKNTLIPRSSKSIKMAHISSAQRLKVNSEFRDIYIYIVFTLSKNTNTIVL